MLEMIGTMEYCDTYKIEDYDYDELEILFRRKKELFKKEMTYIDGFRAGLNMADKLTFGRDSEVWGKLNEEWCRLTKLNDAMFKTWLSLVDADRALARCEMYEHYPNDREKERLPYERAAIQKAIDELNKWDWSEEEKEEKE